jgi:tetratricopeptide (TPR) repeat protein
VGLSPFYQHPRELLSSEAVLGSVVLIAVLSALATWVGLRHRVVLFGWWWFIISLLPVIGFVQVGTQAYADRYAYIPHLGLFTLVVWETYRLLSHQRIGHWIGLVLTTAAIGTCAVLTTFQVGVWRTSETLWTRAIELDPYNAIAHLQLGATALKKQDWTAAEEHYTNVMVYRSSDPDAILNLGFIHQQRREWDQAADYYLWLLRLNPRHPLAAQNLALLPATSRKERHQPLPAAQQMNRQGLQHARRGELLAALPLFREAADLDPQDALSQNNVATAMEELNMPDQAVNYYERALKAKPGDVEAIHGLDRIRKRQLQK